VEKAISEWLLMLDSDYHHDAVLKRMQRWHKFNNVPEGLLKNDVTMQPMS
jgi:hypothetical protein